MLLLRKLLSLVLVLVLSAGTVTRAASTANERHLKAATILSMLRLVTWRGASPSAPVSVLVIGDPALADALRHASVRHQVDGRAVGVGELPSISGLPDMLPMVVVLAARQRPSARALVRAVGARPVLTIGEGDDMSEAGLVIGVYVDGDRIRFDANTAAASRAGLFLSSHLLRLARIVG